MIIYAIVIELYCNKVHAQTTSFAWGSSVVSTTSGSSLEITRNTNFMNNLGEGKILFNFSLTGNAQIFNVLAVTYNNGTATNWQCDFSSMVTYVGNQETTQTATAICPVGYTGNQGLRKIQVTFRQNGGVGLGLGDYYTWSNSEIASNDTTIINNINANITSLANKLDSIYSKQNDINTNMVSKFNDILTILQTNNSSLETKIQQQTQQQQQNYNEFKNADISNSDKQPLDTSNSDSVANKENQIYDTIKQEPSELDILSINLDPDTNNWIWNTFQAIVSTHRYIIILITSVLTIGLGKQILGR